MTDQANLDNNAGEVTLDVAPEAYPMAQGFDMDDDFPASDQTSETPGGEALPLELIDGKVKYEGQEYDLESFKALFESGKNVSEQQKAATQKFQEAADLRKSLEAEMEQFKPIKELGQYLRSLPPDTFNELVRYAGELESKGSGTQVAGQGGPAQSPHVSSFEVPATLSKIDRADLNETGQVLYDALVQLSGVVKGLGAGYQDMSAKMSEVKTVLPEVSKFAQETKAERESRNAADKMSAEFGFAIPPADVLKAMQETGISDPEAAWLKLNRGRLASEAATKAAASAGNKPRGAPNGEGREFDPSGLDADEIMRRLNMGMTPKGK